MMLWRGRLFFFFGEGVLRTDAMSSPCVCLGPCWEGGRVRDAYIAFGPLISPSALIIQGVCVSLQVRRASVSPKPITVCVIEKIV